MGSALMYLPRLAWRGLDGDGAVDCVLDGGLGHLAAGVVFYDYSHGVELFVEVDGSQCP